tara:strand:+ start:402 stop:524 length:123 start_codon:yes stop_codon:yes gene_type:complete
MPKGKGYKGKKGKARKIKRKKGGSKKLRIGGRGSYNKIRI